MLVPSKSQQGCYEIRFLLSDEQIKEQQEDSTQPQFNVAERADQTHVLQTQPTTKKLLKSDEILSGQMHAAIVMALQLLFPKDKFLSEIKHPFVAKQLSASLIKYIQ